MTARGRNSPDGSQPTQPGWPEISIGVVVLLVLELGLARIAFTAHLPANAPEIFMIALSAIMAGGGFAAAFALRLRRGAPFGFVRKTWK